ncbi:MAG: FCD domain-containing protein, partial [Planctomycetaceae bacterium]
SYLMGMINSLRFIVGRLRLLGLRADSTWSRAWDEHAQLIGLLEKRDKEAAARFLKKHLVNAVSDVLMGKKMVEASATPLSLDSVPKDNPSRS